MEKEAVARLHFYTHLADSRYYAGLAAYYPSIEAYKPDINVENNLNGTRVEQSSLVVQEEQSDTHIIEMESHRRNLMSPKVCKGVMWIQMVTASVICLVWCLAQLK
ncbi:uncharacterized protein LOC110181934 [Drosophila serrata]|uniref:uncharacterized protein LOC110181934 n=1 Tax=Drosophila serrata TaxID=7274 RepID=UPI000A1D1B3C|nr:uncharacterized protein LOC110181934 [Drosophila serrata]KAH8356577.1 hypothetical protein KR200_006634 [Drosophila serrata]